MALLVKNLGEEFFFTIRSGYFKTKNKNKSVGHYAPGEGGYGLNGPAI